MGLYRKHRYAIVAAIVGALLFAGALLATSGCQSEPSLQVRLDAQRDEFRSTAPPERVKRFEQGIETVRQSGIEGRAKNVGDRAPDFTLARAAGGTFHLAEALQDGPVVLLWYRGGWCPYCNTQLQAMQQVLPQIHQAGGQLVAISPEQPSFASQTRSKLDLDYVLLSDPGNRVAGKYDIVYTLPGEVAKDYADLGLDLERYNDDTSNQLPLAVTYVIDTDGVIRYAFIDADYRRRAEPADVVRAIGKPSSRQD
jgi:peroxiredoxin